MDNPIIEKFGEQCNKKKMDFEDAWKRVGALVSPINQQLPGLLGEGVLVTLAVMLAVTVGVCVWVGEVVSVGPSS